ncbi:hypothetical protein ABZ815_20170 [Nonomuraea sp. NPDC047529]|uniref:hypothetical protein n=1 Tax=Nonomuraea sp. NPDC047529 TaxID=3155623 RepID=UPI0033DFAF43
MAINVGELFVTIDLRDQSFATRLRRAVGDAEQASRRFRTSAAGITTSVARMGVEVVVAAARMAILSAAAGAVTNSVISLGAALAPAVGLVAALPGAAALGAAGLLTLTVALSGVGDAFEAALGADQKKFEEAISGLSPAAQAAARELRELRPVLLAVGNLVQDALFAPLAGQLTALADVLVGPLAIGMSSVASAIAGVVVRVAEFARSGVAVSAIGAVFASLRRAVDELAVAIDPVLTGLARITQVGAQFAAGLAPELALLAARFGTFLSRAADSGRALAWMEGAVQVLRQLGGIASDVWDIVSGVFAAMRATGSDALGVLGTVLDRIAVWVNSLAGQQTLTAIFVALGQMGSALAPALVAVAEGVGLLAPLVAALAVQIGPILTAAIQAVVPALAALFPGVSAIFAALGRAVQAVAPALVPLATAFSSIMVAVAPLLPVVGQLAALVAQVLAAAVQASLPSLNLLVAAFALAARELAPMLPLLGALAVVLAASVIPAVAPLLPQLAALTAQLVTGLVPILGPVIALLAQVGGQLGQILLQALVQVTPAVITLVAAVAELLPVILPLLPPLLQLVTTLLPPLITLVQSAAMLLRGDLVGAIGTAGRAILEFLVVIDNLGWQLLQGLWNGIQSAAGWFRDVIWGFFRNILPDWVRQAMGINSPSTLFAEIGHFTMLGMAQGMQNSARTVLATASRIAGDLERSFRPELSVDIGSTGRTVTGTHDRPGGPVNIQVTAINPVAEPTSETVNRGLAYAGMLGVL